MKNGESAGTPVARFAAELRARRTRSGWSQADLAAKLGYSGSHVSSIETMDRIPVAAFADACDKAFETSGTFARLHDDITKQAHPPWFAPFVQFEQAARRMHNWDPRFFTGLLQTEATPVHLSGQVTRKPRMMRLSATWPPGWNASKFERELPPSCWFVVGRRCVPRPVRGR